MSAAEINHVGLTVTDIDAAVGWYTDVFGLVPVFGPVEVRGPGRSKAVFGAGFEAMKRAVLSSRNGAGLELFEFLEPPTVRNDDPFRYWQTGPFHVCLTCDDVAAQLAAVAGAGGRARTEPLDAGDGRQIAYCEDPFGNVLELTNRTIAATYPPV
jgi:catechol 2,3-dioxygenase-like lactoylglutathione lyase family enzyme